MATYSSILAWEIPGTEEAGRLQAMGSQGVGQDLVTKQQSQVEALMGYSSSIRPESSRQLGISSRAAPGPLGAPTSASVLIWKSRTSPSFKVGATLG